MKRKIALVSYFSLCFMFLLSQSAQAYIDPSVTTYVVQAVAGIAVAIGAVVTIFWNRAKRKVQEKMNIEEASKKEVEEDIVITSDPQ